MAGLNLNLLDQLTFYGSYHSNKWNQLIHFFFVPAIFWSAGVWLASSGPLVSVPLGLRAAAATLPSWLSSGLQFNVAFFIVVAYCLYYLTLEPVAGLSWSVLVGLPLWLTATAFQQQVHKAGLWALGIHVFSWYMQIHPGHAILEGRKPALLDSLVQAFTLAPLFVWFELLFLLGYRPQLFAELQKRVAAETSKLKKKGA
jgi:uncharacterized membrane protein YGL010W